MRSNPFARRHLASALIALAFASTSSASTVILDEFTWVGSNESLNAPFTSPSTAVD